MGLQEPQGRGCGNPLGLQGESQVYARPRTGKSWQEKVQEGLPRCLR